MALYEVSPWLSVPNPAILLDSKFKIICKTGHHRVGHSVCFWNARWQSTLFPRWRWWECYNAWGIDSLVSLPFAYVMVLIGWPKEIWKLVKYKENFKRGIMVLVDKRASLCTTAGVRAEKAYAWNLSRLGASAVKMNTDPISAGLARTKRPATCGVRRLLRWQCRESVQDRLSGYFNA